MLAYPYKKRRGRYDERGRDWSDAAASQGEPRTDGHHKKLGRDKAGFSQESQMSMALLTP